MRGGAGAGAPGRDAVRFGSLDRALAYVFSSFEARHTLTRGEPDARTRRPEVLAGIAARRGLMPAAGRCVIVSGSKGKGSTSRLIAWNLGRRGRRVGLVLGPEEVAHPDRLRIDNRPIPEPDLVRILEALAPDLDAALAAQPASWYLPPSGVFLLAGLQWFREQGVDTWVIEGGRGVRFDEVGRIPARLGVVTSVLAEHVPQLGRDRDEVAADKLSLRSNCATVLVPDEVAAIAGRLGIGPDAGLCRVDDGAPDPGWPRWYSRCARLAAAAVDALEADGSGFVRFAVPSFREIATPAGRIVLDGAVRRECIDVGFLHRGGFAGACALVGLDSGKDADGILAALAQAGVSTVHGVALRSRAGHVDSDWMRGRPELRAVAELEVVTGGGPALRAAVDALVARHGTVYALGVQTFLRSLRQAYGVPLLEPVAIGS